MNNVHEKMKHITFLLVCVLVLSHTGSLNVLAEEEIEENADIVCIGAEVDYGDVKLRELTAEEQKLRDEGKVQAMQVDDIDAFMSGIEKGTVDITDCIEDLPAIQTFSQSNVASKYIGVHPVPVPPVKINCQFTYQTKKNAKGKYYFTSISKIKTWLTGLKVPVNYTWSQKGCTKKFSNAKQNVKITVNGVISTHVLIKGVGKILDQNMSYSFDFVARK